MRPSLAAAGFSVALLCASAAASAPAPSQRESAGPPTDLGGLTVAVSRTPPVVVSTWPAANATVPSGVTVLKVTFDQAMDPSRWSFAKGEGGDLPACLAKPRLLNDAKTFVLLCTTAPGVRYAVRLNDGTAPGFLGVGGRAAAPYQLDWTTQPDETVRSLPDALKVAGLKDDEGPVEGADPAPK